MTSLPIEPTAEDLRRVEWDAANTAESNSGDGLAAGRWALFQAGVEAGRTRAAAETTEHWRAVFSYPNDPTSYGPARLSREQAEQDHPVRAEENHGWRSGVERQTRGPWEPQP